MIAYTHTLIGVLFVTQFDFSWHLNCTTITMKCPTAAQWSKRGRLFNCPGNKRYICLMASEAELREGCIFDSIIPAGRLGCPYTNKCDTLTGQPVLVTENNYLPCPPDSKGCPPRNHSGYSILKIYKYPRCQGKNISDKSTVLFPEKATEYPTIFPPATNSRNDSWATTIILFMVIGIILIILGIGVFILRGKILGLWENWRRHRHRSDEAKKPSVESGDCFRTSNPEYSEIPVKIEERQDTLLKTENLSDNSDDEDSDDLSDNATTMTKPEIKSQCESKCSTRKCKGSAKYYCMDRQCMWKKYICEKCLSTHHLKHIIIPYVNHDLQCKDHNYMLQYFCQRCQGYICHKCIDDHAGHSLDNLDVRIDLLKYEIQTSYIDTINSEISVTKYEKRFYRKNSKTIEECLEISPTDKVNRKKDNEKKIQEVKSLRKQLLRQRKSLEQIVNEGYLRKLEFFLKSPNTFLNAKEIPELEPYLYAGNENSETSI